MSGYQQVIIVGNVGRVDELKYLQSGVPVLGFTVAVSQVSGSGENRTEKTTWFRVSAWRQLAESLAPYIVKGKQLMVVGTIEARAYVDKSNQPQAQLELNAREIKLLGSRQEGEGGRGEYNDYGAPAPDNMGDIPF